MWVVAFMAALMLGTVMSMDGGVAEAETDETGSDEDDGMTPDPVVAIEAPDAEGDSGGTPASVSGESDAADEDDDDDDGDTDAAETPGVLIANNGEETVFGTEGNDTLTADSFGPITIDTSSTDINLLGGNDVAELAFSSLFTTNVDGGDGDDTIEGTTRSPLLILGGAGDDVLSSVSEGGIQGGEGNDSISADLSDIFEGTTISGGDGEDVIEISTQIGGGTTFAGSADVSGGEGADRFTLELELLDTAIGAEGSSPITSDSNITIRDFDAAEDVLQLEITRPEGAEERDAPEISLVRDDSAESAADHFTDVTLTFAATETSEEVVSVFRVFSEEALSLEEIVLVDAVDPAAAS